MFKQHRPVLVLLDNPYKILLFTIFRYQINSSINRSSSFHICKVNYKDIGFLDTMISSFDVIYIIFSVSVGVYKVVLTSACSCFDIAQNEWNGTVIFGVMLPFLLSSVSLQDRRKTCLFATRSYIFI